MTMAFEQDVAELAVLRRDFRRSGYIILRQFFDRGVMETLDQEAQKLWADDRGLISPRNLRCRYMSHQSSGERLFECFDPVTDLSSAIANVARHERLLQMLAALYGGQAHLFKDKLIFKPAGALGYPLHQDYIAWPEFPKTFLTVLVPLDSATEENGCTVIYEGCHEHGLLTPADGKFHPVPRELVSKHRRVPLILDPGDIAIFHGFTPHESNANCSSKPRRQLYLSYNADDDGGDQRDAHYRQFHRWLREKYPQPSDDEWYFA
jgi:hypothetical protein